MKRVSAPLIAMVLALTPYSSAKADPVTTLAMGAAVAASAYFGAKACGSLLESGLVGDAIGGLRRLAGSPERARIRRERLASLDIVNETLQTEVQQMQPVNAGISFVLNYDVKLAEAIALPPDHTQEYRGIGRSLGGRALASHIGNVIEIESGAPATFIQKFRAKRGLARLEEKRWPLTVTLKDDEGGRFANDMNLALYVDPGIVESQAMLNAEGLLIALNSQQMTFFNAWADRNFVDDEALPDRLNEWAAEFRAQNPGSQIGVLASQGPSDASRSLFGPTRTETRVIQISNAATLAEYARANLYVLFKLGEWIKSSGSGGEAKFKAGYLTPERIRQNEKDKAERERERNSYPTLMRGRGIL